MKTPLRIPLALLGLSIALAPASPVGAALAQDPVPATPQQVRYTAQELDNLVAPIALYPDAILAQVLIASTFPDQIDFAAKHLRVNGALDIEAQSWDVSVKSVAHYPPVINMMADRPDWTTALGQAYAGQSSDVMQAVQRLRQMANAQGNLVSTPQQNVVDDRGEIRIEPAQPTVIYVPTYDPAVIYYEPVRIVGPYAGYWSWGFGFPIGGWLSYDCDWYGGVVFYNGWAGGWRGRSRPFVTFNTVYVSPRARVASFNRGIFSHAVNYGALGRFNSVHNTVTFENRGRGVFNAREVTSPVNGGHGVRVPPTVNRDRVDARPENRPTTWSRQSQAQGERRPSQAQERSAAPVDRGVFRAPPVRQQAPPPPSHQQSAPPSHSSGGSSGGSHSSGGSSHSSSSSSSKGSDRRH